MVQTSSPIRWGILGTGTIAREFAYGLSCLPDAKLVAVGSRTLGSAQPFAQAYAIPQVHSSYQALAEDPAVDVIYIATPHFRHYQDCLLCLNAGKAVLCEKPLALNAKEAQEIADTARRQGVFCMEAMWMRFMPLVKQTQALIAEGTIGEVLTLTADFGYPTEYDPKSRFFNLDLGGGALLDRGSYPLSLAFQLLGAPESAVGQACLGKTGVDEQAAFILGYANGQLAQLAATLRGYASNTAVITGTKGKITLHPPFCRPDRLSVTPYSEQPVVRSSQPSASPSALKRRLVGLGKRIPLAQAAVAKLRDNTKTLSTPIQGNGFNYEAAEVMACLRQQQLESPTMPLGESVQMLKIMDRLRQSWGLHYPQDQ
ncbi:MAG: gfo/Idh/MocA family oxidoreductase [Leptolyngbya sp. LCM1.Bin17]|nr:MAG: gfo/Idh/MocA family oxidoreductase [Leptolyngbya sp. LCM1.Bin17]